jgi:hypothetical protein
MRFGDVWGEESGPEPLVPDGTHSAEILESKERTFKFFQEPKNPSGAGLLVVLSVPGYQSIETKTPVHYRGKIEAICRAARVPLPSPDEDWDERSLVGRMVMVETSLDTRKDGSQYVKVLKWHPGAEPLATSKPAPARTAAAKVEAAGQQGADDDIPF